MVNGHLCDFIFHVNVNGNTNLKTTLTTTFQAKMPPDSPFWEPHSVSTVDLWTFIVASSHRGEPGMVVIYASKKARRFETWFKDVNRIRNATLW